LPVATWWITPIDKRLRQRVRVARQHLMLKDFYQDITKNKQ